MWLSASKLFGLGCLAILVLIGIKVAGDHEANTTAIPEVLKVTEEEKAPPSKTVRTVIDTRAFIERERFYKSLIKEPKDLGGGVVAGIVPHHNVAAAMIGDFYRRAEATHKAKPYDLVVVISPNHGYIGAPLQIGHQRFTTYGDGLNTDVGLADALVAATEATYAKEAMMATEHGQLIHMPYIDATLTAVPVLPIVVTTLVADEVLSDLVTAFAELTEGRHVLYIASIDFSHNLPYEEAQKKDAYTETLLKENDGTRMAILDDRFLDSPKSYKLWTLFLNELRQTETTIIDHSNSAEFLNRYDSTNTTSYFEVLVTK